MQRIVQVTGISTLVKKFILSWLLLASAIALCFLIKSFHLTNVFLLGILFFCGVLNLLISRLSYDDDNIYVNGVKYSADDLVEIKTINLNLFTYVIIKVKQKDRIKRFLIDPGIGGFGFTEVIISLFYKNSSINKWVHFVDWAKKRISDNKSKK